MTDPDHSTLALALEAEGDRLTETNRVAEALAKYREAEALGAGRKALYEKLIATHERLAGDEAAAFEQADLTDVVYWTMRLQELETPRLKYLHDHFKGADRDAEALIERLLVADDAEEGALLEKIETLGERALRPLLYFFLNLKHAARAPQKDGAP